MKRNLIEIQSEIERLEEDSHKTKERINKLQEEIQKNVEYQRQEEFRKLFDKPLYELLFTGKEPLINLGCISAEKAKKIVSELKNWRDKAVKLEREQYTRNTRIAIKSEEYIDCNPYDGRCFTEKGPGIVYYI